MLRVALKEMASEVSHLGTYELTGLWTSALVTTTLSQL